MNFSYQRVLDYTAAILDTKPDIVYTGGNVPGGFLGKRVYDKYVLPYEKKHIDFIQSRGIPVMYHNCGEIMYHNCGEIMNLVESYKELGARIIEPFSPPPLGDTDLAKAKEIVNGEYIMLSGIDQVNLLQKGTIDEIKKATEQVMKIGKPGGKSIFQPVDFLEYGTPFENIEAFVKTAIDNALY